MFPFLSLSCFRSGVSCVHRYILKFIFWILLQGQNGITPRKKTTHSFASAISRSNASLTHFKFIAGFRKCSQAILIYPCSRPASLGPTPLSEGGSGVQRGP